MARGVFISLICALVIAMLAMGGLAAYEAAKAGYPYALVVMGEGKWREGDIDGAMAEFNHAIALNPKLIPAYMARGRAEKVKLELPAAIADFTTVIGLDSKHASAYCWRGFARLYQSDLDGAIADFNQVVLLNPQDEKRPEDLDGFYAVYGRRLEGDAMEGRGRVEYLKGDFTDSIKDYSWTIQLWPNVAAYYLARGMAREASDDLHGALADFDTTVKLNPQDFWGYLNGARVRTEMDDFDGAIADCSQALKIDPSSVEAYVARGYAKSQSNDWRGAFADFDKAMAVDPHSSEGWYYRAWGKVALWDLNGAVADSNHAIQLAPGNPDRYRERGMVEGLMQEWPDALKDLRQAQILEKRPKPQDYICDDVWLARIHMGENESARKELADHFEKSRPKDSKSWPVLVGRYAAGDLGEGELLAATANALNSKLARYRISDAWFFIGEKSLVAQDKQKAVEAFKKCVGIGIKGDFGYQLSMVELRKLGQ